MEYSFFVTNVVKHVVVADFEPILGKKIAHIFEAVQTAVNSKKPEKARKIKKNTPYIEQPKASAPLGADWSVEINADYQKRGRKSKKKYAIKNIILPLSKRDYYAAIAVFPSFY